MSRMRSNSALERTATSGAGGFPPRCAPESFALHEAANFKRRVFCSWLRNECSPQSEGFAGTALRIV